MYPWDRRLDGLQSLSGRCGRFPCRESNLARPAPVATPMEKSRLQVMSMKTVIFSPVMTAAITSTGLRCSLKI
jgi:hypothetical protein